METAPALLRTAAILSLLTWLGGCRPALPELSVPELKGFSAHVRAQIGVTLQELHRHPRDAAANARFGMEMLTYQFPDAAEIAFRRAHLLEPRHFGWLYLHAMALVNRDENAPAVLELRQAIALLPNGDPQMQAARLALADTLLHLGRHAEAGGEFRQLLVRDPDSARASYGLGKSLEMQGKYAEAAESYRRACKQFPTYGAAYFSLAGVYRRMGEDDKAAEALSFRQTAGDGAPPLGNPQDDPWLAAVLESNESSVILIQRGLAAAMHGDLPRAIFLHEQAVTWQPEDFDAHVNLVGFYTTIGDPGRAELHERAAAALHPDDPKLLNFYAMLLASEKRNTEAVALLKQALLANPKSDELNYNLGYLLEQQGSNAEALGYFRKAYQSNDKQRGARFHAGRLLLELGRGDDAGREFLPLMLPAPDQSKMLRSIAASYRQVHRLDLGRRLAANAQTIASKQHYKSLEPDLLYFGYALQ